MPGEVCNTIHRDRIIHTASVVCRVADLARNSGATRQKNRTNHN
ncbi:hypothetical protein WRPBWLFC_CDS0028 [Escherichia phage SM_S22]